MTLNNIKQLKKENGFTIIELLIVIIVIGILATLVLVGYNNIQGQANDTKRQADASSIRDAAAAYKVASTAGQYPALATCSGTVAACLTASQSFGSAIGTAGNYANGQSPINLDTNISNNMTRGALATYGPAAATGNNGYYTVSFCADTAANQTPAAATGLRVYYFKNGATTATLPYVTTGTNTGAVAATNGCEF